MNTVKRHNILTHPGIRLGAVLATLLITGCNNGNNCTGCGGGGSGTANLEASVSGLVGSRLVLQNNSTRLNQLNGQASNGSNVKLGTAKFNSRYDITVLTQPTNPSQTCVVTSGTGTIGNSDVISIVVTCSTNPPRFL